MDNDISKNNDAALFNAKTFLKVLSKVMNEEGSVQRINGYNELYSNVKTNLLQNMLKTSLFPDTPAESEMLDDALAEIEFLGLAPEIIGKNNILFSLSSPQEGFDFLYNNQIEQVYFPSYLSEFPSVSPIILYNSESPTIAAINYANIRLQLSETEYEILTNGCQKNKIDLSKLIDFFLIGYPIENKNNCYIFTGEEYNKFAERIPLIDNLYFIGNNYIRKIVSYGNGVFSKDSSNLTIDEIKKSSKNDINFIYLFKTRMEYALSSIDSFYYDKIVATNKEIKSFTSDIAKISDDVDTLMTLRSNKQEQLDEIRKEFKEYSNCRDTIISDCNTIDAKLYGEDISGKQYSMGQLNNTLKCFFVCAEHDMQKSANNYILDIQNHAEWFCSNLLTFYLENIGKTNRKPVKVDVLPSFSSAETEWAISKIKLELELGGNEYNREKQYNELLSTLMTAGMKIETAAELFALALYSKEKAKTNLLEKSFSMGNCNAGNLLYEEAYSLNDEIKRTNKMKFLASGLNESACMSLCDNKNININSNERGYLKIAASLNNTDAIMKIVDIVFSNYFNKNTIVSQSEPSVNCEALISMCEYLIEIGEQPMKYKEDVGIIYFVLAQYSLSYKNLKGCNSSSANYCKGVMSETGYGTVKNRKKAIEYYQKCSWKVAKDKEKELQDEEEEEEDNKKNDSAEEYDSSKDYSSESNTIHESSGCFITTAACRALNAKDNCEELETLRKFRDEHILDSNNGQQLVYEYYRIGPTIVKCIDSQSNSQEIYDNLWKKYIHPSFEKIKQNDWENAQMIYITMVKELCEQFNVEVDKRIAKKYSIKSK